MTALTTVLGAQAAHAPVATAATQGLSLTATTDPVSVSRVGPQVDVTIAVRNRGDQSVRDLLVTAPGPALSALRCSPVALGGVLGAGRTTTCRASRTIAPGDLKAGRTDTVKATGKVGSGSAATTVNAATTVSVAVAALPPKATDDTVPGVVGGPDVILPGASNDVPGEAAGPAVDPTRTVLVGGTADPAYGTRAVTTTEGRWSVLPNGSVRFTPGLGHPGVTAQVAYRVYDVAGRSAVGQLRVPLRRGPVASPHALSVVQGASVAIDVLKLDDPGLKADGTPASFVRVSLRLAGVSPSGGLGIDYVADRSSIRVHGVCDFVVDPRALTIIYDRSPFPTVSTTIPTLSYSALTTAGTEVHGTVSVKVVPTTGVDPSPRELPEALSDGALTTPQVPVVLAGQTNDLPGRAPLDSSKLAFPTDQLQFLPPGSTIADVGGEQVLTEPGQGTFTTNRADGTIRFVPDRAFMSQDGIPGNLGSVLAEYAITDSALITSRAYASVGLSPGPTVKPDSVTTRQGRSVNANVLADDYAGRSQLLGSPATFGDPQLTTAGLPAGSAVAGSGSTLTVPGEGVYSVSPGNRTVTFAPAPTFRGKASLVTLALAVSVPRQNDDPAAVDLRSTLQVTVLGSDPVAKADTAFTPVGQPVVAAVLANDAPGSPVVPLVASSVRLRTTSALPAGSTLYGDAKTLVVARRGTFLVAGNGQITFVPLGTATGPVPAVGYEVADVNGTTARSTLTVTVR